MACEDCKRIHEDMDEIREYIIGKPSQPGLVGKVDLLLARADSARWWTRTAIGSAVVSGIAAIIAWVKGGAT